MSSATSHGHASRDPDRYVPSATRGTDRHRPSDRLGSRASNGHRFPRFGAACDSALPAAVFDALAVLLERRTLLAARAARGLVRRDGTGDLLRELVVTPCYARTPPLSLRTFGRSRDPASRVEAGFSPSASSHRLARDVESVLDALGRSLNLLGDLPIGEASTVHANNRLE